MSSADSQHKHWSHMDEMLEQLEFRRLDHMLRLGETVDWEADLARLNRLAQGAGYGQTDGLITDKGLEAAEDGPDADYTESDYFRCIRESEMRLRSLPRSPENIAKVVIAMDQMRKSFANGREMRIEESRAAAPGIG